MNPTPIPTRRRTLIDTSLRTTGGFTLIELMIAMLIGIVILLALSTLFLNTSRTSTELAKTNSVIENGRFTLQLLQDDLVHAGFWGDYVPTFDNLTYVGAPPAEDIPATVPGPCDAWPAGATDKETRRAQWIGMPIQAYESTPAGCTMTDRKAGTDVLVARHAETCEAGVGTCEALAAGRIYFQSSLCSEDAVTHTLEVLADAADPAGSGFTLNSGNCTTTAAMRRLSSNIYFVRDGTVPTLMRTRWDGSGFITEALIEGVEEFRVELGIDDVSATGAAADPEAAIIWDATATNTPTNRGDGAPDSYVRCTDTSPCTPDQLINTTAVKLFVLARSPEPSASYTDTKTYCLATLDSSGNCPAGAAVTPGDKFKRHLFTTTVRLNSVSGRRETPE
jgi:type IV pilus assembly protein PilW